MSSETPESSHEAMTFTTFTTAAMMLGLSVSPAPKRHIEPTIITPQSGMPSDMVRT